MNTLNELITVFSVELTRRLRSRFFIAGLLIGVVGIALFVELPNLLSKTIITRIVLVGEPRVTSQAKLLLDRDFSVVATERTIGTPTVADLNSRHADGVVQFVRAGSGLRLIVYAKDPNALRAVSLRRDLVELNLQLATNASAAHVKSLLEIPVDVHVVGSKFKTAEQSEAALGVAYALLIVLYLLILLNGQSVMTSVAEEKTSRIAELLVASVRPTSLLVAKVGASMVLALIQMATWISVAVFFSTLSPPPATQSSGLGTSSDFAFFALSSISVGDVVAFVVFFLLGFFQTAMLFAAVGALINRTEDVGTMSYPVLMPTLAGFFIATSALAVPDAAYVKITSFIPMLSTYVMFERIVASTVPFWQILVAVVLNVIALWGIAVVAGKLYRVGMLLYGRAPSFAQVWKVLRT